MDEIFNDHMLLKRHIEQHLVCSWRETAEMTALFKNRGHISTHACQQQPRCEQRGCAGCVGGTSAQGRGEKNWAGEKPNQKQRSQGHRQNQPTQKVPFG